MAHTNKVCISDLNSKCVARGRNAIWGAPWGKGRRRRSGVMKGRKMSGERERGREREREERERLTRSDRMR